MPKPLSIGLVAALIVGTLFAQSVAVMLSSHDELLSVTPGDLALRQELEALEEGTIYTENMHWGYLWDLPQHLDSTSIPTLGLVHLTMSEQSNATRALYLDNTTYFIEHNMRYAVTSPLGSMQWILSMSPYWESSLNRDGAILWEVQLSGDAETAVLQAVHPSDCLECENRLDPWRDHRFKDPLNLGDTRAFIKEGTADILTIDQPSGDFSSVCLVYETIGTPKGINVQSDTGLERPFQSLKTQAGYHHHCMELKENETLVQLEILWENDRPSRFINPLGLSGRDNVLIDSTGVRLHWIEWMTR